MWYRTDEQFGVRGRNRRWIWFCGHPRTNIFLGLNKDLCSFMICLEFRIWRTNFSFSRELPQKNFVFSWRTNSSSLERFLRSKIMRKKLDTRFPAVSFSFSVSNFMSFGLVESIWLFQSFILFRVYWNQNSYFLWWIVDCVSVSMPCYLTYLYLGICFFVCFVACIIKALYWMLNLLNFETLAKTRLDLSILHDFKFFSFSSFDDFMVSRLKLLATCFNSSCLVTWMTGFLLIPVAQIPFS